MARYFFDIDENGTVVPDEEGIECASRPVVRDMALGALPGLASDAPTTGKRHVIKITVRDQAREPVLLVTLTREVDWLEES